MSIVPFEVIIQQTMASPTSDQITAIVLALTGRMTLSREAITTLAGLLEVTTSSDNEGVTVCIRVETSYRSTEASIASSLAGQIRRLVPNIATIGEEVLITEWSASAITFKARVAESGLVLE